LSVPVDRFRFLLRERWRDRVRFVLYRITTPSRPEDWRFMTVAGRRVAVHGWIRPWQLVLAAVRAALRRNHNHRPAAPKG
jgi:hypothetical protein